MRGRLSPTGAAAVIAALLLPSGIASATTAERYTSFSAAAYARAYEVRQMGDLDWLSAALLCDGEARQSLQDLSRDAPRQDRGRQRDPEEGEAVLRGAWHPDSGWNHPHRQRAQPVPDLLLQRPRRPTLRAGGRRAHGTALRRDHPRRLLLHELQDRGRDPRQGRAELDGVSAGTARRGGSQPHPGPGPQGEPEGQGGHQVPELV